MAVVTGRLQIRDWTDRDGNKRRSAEVVADNIYFGDSKRSDGDSAPRSNFDDYSGSSFSSVPSSDFSELSDEDDDLPF